MIYDLNLKGEWWLPDTVEKIKGELVYSVKDGANLHLFGSFDKNRIYPTADKMILGHTMEGFVTLIDCSIQKNQYETQTGQIISNYRPSIILTGHHFKVKNDINFKTIKFQLFNLREWIAIDGLKEDKNLGNYSLEYKKPLDISFECYPGCSGNLNFNLDVFFPNYPFSRLVEQHVTVEFDYNSLHNFQKILNDIFVLVGLLTLCSYEQSYPLTIEFFSNEVFAISKHGEIEIKTPTPIRCIYQNSFYKDSFKLLKGNQPLIKFESIQNNISRVITAWYEKNLELGPVIRLVLSSFQDKFNFKNDNFLDIVKGLEAFHRIKFCQGIPFKKQPGLKRRLLELISVYSFSYFNERVADPEKFCIEAKDSRNYLTHLDSVSKEKCLDGKELFDLSENLKLLLLSCIFQSIGINPDQFEDGLKGKIY